MADDKQHLRAIAEQIIASSGVDVGELVAWECPCGCGDVGAVAAWDAARSAVWFALTVTQEPRNGFIVVRLDHPDEVASVAENYPYPSEREAIEVVMRAGLGEGLRSLFTLVN